MVTLTRFTVQPVGRASSRSAGLDELLALPGATQDSLANAATVLERLTLVRVSPNGAGAAQPTSIVLF